MNEIPLEVQGKVLNAPYPNMTVLVRHDPEQTGGYFIFQWWDGSNGPNEHSAFDDWVESAEDLQQYFTESGWTVEWEKPQ
jgi:hypothetical protein